MAGAGSGDVSWSGWCQAAQGQRGLGPRGFRLEGFVVGLCHGLGFGDRRLLVDGRKRLGEVSGSGWCQVAQGRTGSGCVASGWKGSSSGCATASGSATGGSSSRPEGLGRGFRERLVPGGPGQDGLGLRRFRLEGFVVGLCHGLGFGDRRLLVDGRKGSGEVSGSGWCQVAQGRTGSGCVASGWEGSGSGSATG